MLDNLNKTLNDLTNRVREAESLVSESETRWGRVKEESDFWKLSDEEHALRERELKIDKVWMEISDEIHTLLSGDRLTPEENSAIEELFALERKVMETDRKLSEIFKQITDRLIMTLALEKTEDVKREEEMRQMEETIRKQEREIEALEAKLEVNEDEEGLDVETREIEKRIARSQDGIFE